MRFTHLGTGSRVVAAIVAVVLVAGSGLAVARVARASDHQDNPLVELNPAMDMTDVYAFPGSSADRVVLVLNSWAFLTPGQTSTVSFDPNLLYQFKINLQQSQPPIWRRIQVSNCTLDKLHEHIQTSMGWTNSHLHHFRIGDQRYGDPMLMEEDFVEMGITAK